MKPCSVVLFTLLVGAPSIAVAQPPRPANKQFGDLFREPPTTGPAVRLQVLHPQPGLDGPMAPAPMPPTVVCGMTLVPGDPQIDKGIEHDTPKTPRFSIQTIEPQVCRR